MDGDWTKAFVIFGIGCAIAGWAAIQGFMWICSHISFGWLA